MPRKQPDQLVLDYLALRRAVGWIGLTFPFTLMIGGFVFETIGHQSLHIESSISSYYYTGMGNVFVGLLCAIGVFHVATDGYDLTDRIAGRLVCIFSLGVAWFPTTPHCIGTGKPTDAQRIIGDVHYTFAALLFATLAFFCIFQFTQTVDKSTRTRRKRERNIVYYVCGSTIVACILVIGTVKFVVESLPSLAGFLCWLRSWEWNFWFESLALVAFGFAFLIKGEFILKDEPRPFAELTEIPLETSSMELPPRN